ncbi:MAG: HEPN domain-containing protein [Candidatus Poribacteria bacterium]
MATWQELSLECLRAAKMLAGEGYWRSSVNRSYYAAYCAVTSELVARGVRFARGWNNPPHEQLLNLITHNLSLPLNVRRRLRKFIRLLRHAREDADYRPGASVDRATALNCIRSAVLVLRDLGVLQYE